MHRLQREFELHDYEMKAFHQSSTLLVKSAVSEIMFFEIKR